LIGIFAAAIALALFQIVPLPPNVWGSLPGRAPIILGYATLEYPTPWQPLSWAPQKTLQAAYAFVPPIAVMLAIILPRTHRERSIAGVVIIGALGSVVLGALQMASIGPESWSYIYKYTNPGAVGFFSNRNHMATLLLSALPFAAALFAAGHPHVRSRSTAVTMAAMGAGGVLLILAGLALNGSLAALALAVPVMAFSVLLLPFGWRHRGFVIPIAGLAFAVSLAVLATSWAGSVVAGNPQLDSVYSRGQIWSLTLKAIGNTFPFGTGLGTFTGVYAMQENPATVTVAWVNHAHNDYLELMLETGLPGLLLMIAFLGWFVFQTVRIWRAPFSGLYAKAATIAASAMLVHSIVDYPLRTTAMAVVFGACLGMMAGPPRQRRSDEARHVRIA
jgi:O-antigen ligase